MDKMARTQLDSKSGVTITRNRLERILAHVPERFLEKKKNKLVFWKLGVDLGDFQRF